MDVMTTTFNSRPLPQDDSANGRHFSGERDHRTPVSFHSIEALSRGVGSAREEPHLSDRRHSGDSHDRLATSTPTGRTTMPVMNDLWSPQILPRHASLQSSSNRFCPWNIGGDFLMKSESSFGQPDRQGLSERMKGNTGARERSNNIEGNTGSREHSNYMEGNTGASEHSNYIESSTVASEHSNYIDGNTGAREHSNYIEGNTGAMEHSNYIDGNTGAREHSNYIEGNTGAREQSNYIEGNTGAREHSNYIEGNTGAKEHSNYYTNEMLMLDGRSSLMNNNVKSENNSIASDMDLSFETKSKRHTRTIYSAKQVQALEEAYSNCHYPNRETLDQLAVDFSLTDEKIRIWFQNKRARSRRHQALQTKLAESAAKPTFASQPDATSFMSANSVPASHPIFGPFSPFLHDTKPLSLMRPSAVPDIFSHPLHRHDPRFEQRTNLTVPFLPSISNLSSARLPPILPPASLVNPASLMHGFDSFRISSFVNGWENKTNDAEARRARYPLCDTINNSRDLLPSANHVPLLFGYNSR